MPFPSRNGMERRNHWRCPHRLKLRKKAEIMRFHPRPSLALSLCVQLALLAGWACQAAAQEKAPFPMYTGDRVYVVDVPGSYQSVEETIKRLERGSPRSYFVVLVDRVGTAKDAATRYVDELAARWSREASDKGLKLDYRQSVITVVAVNDHKVALHPGLDLNTRAGLGKDVLDALISKNFIPLARQGSYAQAITSLLSAIEEDVARPGTATAATAPGLPLVPAGTARPAPRSSVPATAAASTRSTLQSQVLPALLASLLAVGLIVAGLIWLARHRTRSSVEAKIKDFKQKAVDVMDRLDALKNRLKNLRVENPEFKEPMSGATLAMYQQIETSLTTLWDRWLEVMDALDKAQELARKDSALGTQKLKEAEKLVSDSKAFEQIDAEAKRCTGAIDALNSAHAQARSRGRGAGEPPARGPGPDQ